MNRLSSTVRLIIFAALLLASSAHALAIPLTIPTSTLWPTIGSSTAAEGSGDGYVGYVRNNGETDPNDAAAQLTLFNNLLGVGSNTIITLADKRTYSTQEEWSNYVGPVSLPSEKFDGTSNASDFASRVVPSGWNWVFAKYDGPNAGYIGWYLGGATAVVPQDTSIFTNKNGAPYGLSGYVTFNGASVPEGGNILILLGLALTCLGFGFRKFTR